MQNQPSIRRRSLLQAAAATTVAGPALAACGPAVTSDSGADEPNMLQAPDSDTPKGEITIWDRSGDLFEVFEGTIEAFNSVYPDIKVNHLAIDIDAKLQNTLITGTAVPDGVFLDDAKVSGFVDYLWNLKEVLSPYIDDIAPQKISANTASGGIYGIPFDLNPGLLFYNAAALQQAEVDVTAIETYDDLLEAAQAYKEARPDSGPIHLERSEFLGQLQLEMYASQFGTSIADAKGRPRLDSPEFKRILTFLDTVQSDGLGTRAEYTTPTDLAELDNGHQVFYPWAIWFTFAPQQLLEKTFGDWRAMLLPAWEQDGARSGAMGGSSFVLPKDGKNADLAWLFYEFLIFNEAGYSAVWGPSEVYPKGLNTSIPSYLPAADPSKPLFEPIEAFGGQDLWKVATEAGVQVPSAAATPKWWDGAADYLGTNIQHMLDGDMSPTEVLEQSTEKIQTNLVDRQ